MDYCKISLNKITGRHKYSGYQDTAFQSFFGSLSVSPTLKFTRSEFKQESVKHVQGMSISGVQQKMSLAINARKELVPVGMNGRYILKPSPEEFPHAAENEHTAMVLSRLLKIQTAECGLIAFSDGEFAYITKRFDRENGGVLIHQEDLAQGFGLDSQDKYNRSYEEAGRLVQDMTGGKKAACLDFVKRIIFSYLIGNDDLHLKNFSLQRNTDNRTQYYDRLTPNYDVLFTSVYSNTGDNGFLALNLLAEETEGIFSRHYEKYGFYTGHDFIELAQRLKIPNRPIVNFITTIKAQREKIIATVQHSFMPEDMKAAAVTVVQDRLSGLLIGV